jgi:hypothetical protein
VIGLLLVLAVLVAAVAWRLHLDLQLAESRRRVRASRDMVLRRMDDPAWRRAYLLHLAGERVALEVNRPDAFVTLCGIVK